VLSNEQINQLQWNIRAVSIRSISSAGKPSFLVSEDEEDKALIACDTQVDYINKVTKALKESTNAVLESPTGTGKTLCLLCATLAWQNVHKRSAKKTTKQNLEYNEGPLKPLGSETAPAPVSTQSLPSVILYASRTHSQLSQVVSELKNTGYAPRMTVLGSREQLCIQSTFVNLKGGSLTRACNTLTDTHRCMYKNNLEHFSGRAEGVGDRPSPILDIEEIRNMGIRDSVCPYFYSRCIHRTFISF
jgi:regulator of telomere elongation helicase 1